jgi:hypothetical protein
MEVQVANKELPQQSFLNNLYFYDEITGLLTLKATGESAGMRGSGGYQVVKIGDGTFLLHRIIWKMATGDDPEFIDHINGIKTDNRLLNLRSVTKTGNNRNKSTQKNNQSGVNGVTFRRGRWVAQIPMPGGGRHLGQYDTAAEAVAARKAAEKVLGYHRNHGRPQPPG